MKIIGLLDCNNFYASCERVFKPSLKERPIVVLSNNDGCIIARSNEAKALGIPMGEAVFKCKHLINKHNVYVRSANFSLYSDFSQRVMATLEEETTELEVYSIDEAFIHLGDTEKDSPEEIYQRAMKIREKVERYTGISVSIGIATSKTLAKLANKLAKTKLCGVYSLYFDPSDEALMTASLDANLADYDVADLWGVGSGYRDTLYRNGIGTALDLKYANEHWVKQELKVNGLRLVRELKGESCIPLNDYSKEGKSHSIISSRTFGYRVTELDSLEEAVANFTATAAYKLRAKNLAAKEVHVSIRAFKHSRNDDNWRGVRFEGSVKLRSASSSSSKLIKAAHEVLSGIYREGYYYKKASVVFTGLVRKDEVQLSLLENLDSSVKEQENSEKLSALVDRINGSLSVNTLFWASMGTKQKKDKLGWRAKQNNRSGSYTTEWSELPVLR